MQPNFCPRKRSPAWCLGCPWTGKLPPPPSGGIEAELHFASDRETISVTPGDFATIYNLKPLYTAGLDGTGADDRGRRTNSDRRPTIDAFRSRSRAVAGTTCNWCRSIPAPGSTAVTKWKLTWMSNGRVAWPRTRTILYVYVGANSCQQRLRCTRICHRQESGAGHQHQLWQLRSEPEPASPQSCDRTCSTPTRRARHDGRLRRCRRRRLRESQTATTATHGLAVDAPGSIPEVTAIGGSEFTGDATD